jgi:glyoxylate reductase
MKLKAFITRLLPDAAIEIATSSADLDIWPGETPPPRPELIRRASQVDGLLCLLTEKIDADFLDAVPNLRVISQMAVGYDNIDIPACIARGIPVGNTPGVLTETTADLAFALLMATARRVVEADNYTRSGEWKTWSPMLLTGQDVHHATLGIVGMGRIGYEVAKRASGFDMRILYSDLNVNQQAEEEFNAKRVDLKTLLTQSDFVSMHTALTPETHHLIGRAEFAQMKPSAIFINTARGPVVDQSALYEALKTRRIAAAGLDVFEKEPLPKDDSLLALDNAVLLPHIASASIATRTKMAVLAAENLAAGLQGRPLPNPVNPEVRPRGF